MTRHDITELLDDPAAAQTDLPKNLKDIRRLNRWFGGIRLALTGVDQLLESDTRRLLDVATGSADIPLAIWRRAEREGRDLSLTASDVSEDVLAEAQRVVAGTPISLELADARHLPWPDASFDLVTCCLALHHFEPADAAGVLAEMWRVARRGVLVTDLTRGRAAYLGTWLATRVVARNHLTRHDGPVSVLRAYTPPELEQLARNAGIGTFTVRRHFPFRQVLIARRPPGNTGRA